MPDKGSKLPQVFDSPHPVLRQDPGALHLSFWSADWTPWRALAAIAGRWPALRFDTQPNYDGP